MRFIFIILSIVVLFSFNVKAHPGKTDSNGCHHCHGEVCEEYGMDDNFYHTHINGKIFACPFDDQDDSYSNDNYNQDKINTHINENDKSIISIFFDTIENLDDYIGIGLLLFFIFVAIASSIKTKRNTNNEIELIRKDFYENKEKYINKNNPYTKTKVKNVNDYILYKLEYNKRHKNNEK